MADSRKRRNPKEFDGPAFNRKKFDFTNITGYRFLIPTRAGGCLIGKGGEVIKRLRNEFSCRIIIPDSKGPERMVILDGEVDVIIDFWNEVIPLIKEYISAKDCDYHNSGNKHIDDDSEIDLRFVVHESQAGALIGKGGERVRNLISSHNMTIIKVYHTLCPNSTDRVVRMVSSQENIMECLKSMFKLLENQIIKGVRTDYDPDNYDETIAPNYGGFICKDSRFPPRGINNKAGGYHQNDNFMPRHDVFDYGNSSNFDESHLNLPFFGGSTIRSPVSGISDLLDGVIRLHPSNEGKHVARVSLPIQLVTAIIGNDGHRLSDIKRDSGAHILLDDERLNDREELFLIRGTPDQIYKAQCLMQLCARKYGDMACTYAF